MKFRRTRYRTFIGMITLAGLVASGCARDREVVGPPPGKVPIEDGSPASATDIDSPDEPEDTCQGGTEPAVPTSQEPRLAFVSNMNHDAEIVVWSVDGAGEQPLTDNFDDDRLPAWSPNGSRVAFVSDRAGDGDYDIYVVNADGSNPVQVTDDGYRETRLAWSPDGTRIAYVRFTHEGFYRADDFRYGDDLSDHSDEDFDMFVIDADGSNPVRVTWDDYRELAPVWSPDGTRIAYVRDTEPDQGGVRPEIIVVSADGTDPFKLADGADDPVWSPDGSLLAYQDGHSIHLAEPDGSSSRKLVVGYGASWSPDGSLIAFSSDRAPASADRAGAGADADGVLLMAGNATRLYDTPAPLRWEIHVIAPDGTNHTQLTQRSSAGWDKFDPQWSPDGSRILYAYPWGGDGEVYVMNADGTESRLITDNGDNPGWSHDGKHVYYTRFRPLAYRALDIFVIHPDGTNLATLVTDADNPAWSPDGTLIAYSSDGQITVANADGTGACQLTDVLTHSYEGRNFAPVWSPDGTRIAYNHGSRYRSRTYVMEADGANKTLLTQSASHDRTVIWSPDGTRILFDYGHGGVADDIAVINSDGTGLVNLTPDDKQLGLSADMCPRWSPDGSKIAFVLALRRAGAVGGWDDSNVFVIDADGSNLTQVTHSPDEDDCPIWSLDGARIIYSVWRGVEDYYDVADLWIMNADGSDPRLLKEHGTGPVLSPDGTQIAFISDRDGDWEIFVMDSDGSNETQLTFNNDNDWDPTWFPLGTSSS